MANKFFSYSFQVSRAKKAGIVLIIFIIILGTISFLWYRSKNNITKLDDLKYKVVFGMNEFEDGSCDKAYKINYNKNTCGSICIKKLNKDSDYIKNTKEYKYMGKFYYRSTVCYKCYCIKKYKY